MSEIQGASATGAVASTAEPQTEPQTEPQSSVAAVTEIAGGTTNEAAVPQMTLADAQPELRYFDYAEVIADAIGGEGDNSLLAGQLKGLESFPGADSTKAALEKMNLNQDQLDRIADIIKYSSKLSLTVNEARVSQEDARRHKAFYSTIQEEFGNAGTEEANKILSSWAEEVGVPVDSISKTISNDVAINIIKGKMSNTSEAKATALRKFTSPPTTSNPGSYREHDRVFSEFRSAAENGTLWGGRPKH